MNVGKIVKFTQAHVTRSGYEYCSNWIGIVLESSSNLVIYWETGYGSLVANYGTSGVRGTLEEVASG